MMSYLALSSEELLGKFGVMIPQKLLDEVNGIAKQPPDPLADAAARGKCWKNCGSAAFLVADGAEPPKGECWRSQTQWSCKYLPVEAAKVEVKCKSCQLKPDERGLGYAGMCWVCSDKRERLLGPGPQAWPRPEPLRMTGYDNGVAGIGVVPGIWRVHAKAGR